MTSVRFKVNDKVQVVAGKDAGKTGKVTRVIPKKLQVIVEGTNLYKRHMKKQSDKNPGGIISIERPLNVSKVQLVCPSCKKITRIGYSKTPTGETIRLCKKCQAQIDTQTK